MLVSVFVRRLRGGVTYEDFRRAWYPRDGFGVPTRVLNAVRIDDEHEILSVGFVDVGDDDLEGLMERVAAPEATRHQEIEGVVASTELRAVYRLVDDQDFTDRPGPFGGATPGAGITPRGPVV
jgi:hypothetical protein